MRGSSSILFCIILIVLMGLLGCMVDKARFYSMDAKAENSLYMAVDSTFAEYGSQLYKKYGIFSLWMQKEEIVGKVVEYESAYLSPQNKLPYSIFQLNKLCLDDIDLRTYSLVDGNGANFRKQVLEESKVVCAEEGVSFLLEQLGWKEKFDAMKRFMSDINDMKESLEQVSNQVMAVQDAFVQFKEGCQHPKETFRQLMRGLAERKNEELSETLASLLEKMMGEKDKILEKLNQITEEIGRYDRLEQSILNTLESNKEDVLSGVEDESGELEEAFDDVVKSFQPQGNYGIDSVRGKISDLLSLGDMNFDTIKELLVSEKEEERKQAELWLEQWTKAYEDLCDGSVEVSYSANEEDTCPDDFIMAIRTFAEGGILDWICGGQEISAAECPDEGRPSAVIQTQNADSIGLEDRAWITLYGVHYFSHYRKKMDDSRVLYELEYLIGGKNSDRSNLEEISKRFLALRESANLLYLCFNAERRQEAYRMAMMLPGIAAQPILAIAAQVIILGVWALAESIIDVRDLMCGGKVPMIKSNQSWKVSIERLPSFITDLERFPVTKSSGLGYEQYLSFVLMMCNMTEVSGRMLDIIQWNIQKNVNNTFLIEDCVCKVEVKAWMRGKTLFAGLISQNNQEFILSPELEYQY